MTPFNDLLVLGAAAPAGALFSTFKVVLMVLLIAPWLWACTWINRDTRKVHAVQVMWNGLALGAGGLGVLLWLLLPWYAVGLLLYLALSTATIFSYVSHRN